MALFADDVAWLCGQLGIEHVVAVGHSMGGSVVATLAARNPSLVLGAVAVDSPVIALPGASDRLGSSIRALAEAGYLEAATQFIGRMFQPYDDPTRRESIIKGMTSTPQHTMVSALQASLDLDAAALGKVTQPMLLISAGWIPTNLEALREVIPNLRFAQTYGSGHFNMLEVPEQVNAMIERFLAIDVLAEP
jgi:pimeloyl-ACP methyl ester carboxylesterase